MVAARGAFLATGGYEPVSDALNECAAAKAPARLVLDVGCGEGYYARRLAAAIGDVPLGGADVAKSAVASAASKHPAGHYAVASAFDLPLPPGSVDLLVSVFGPVAPAEFRRVVAPGGAVLAVNPGAAHLSALRALVSDAPAPQQIKDPLRGEPEQFHLVARCEVRYPLAVTSLDVARQLFTMTPYRWHAPRDIEARLDLAVGAGLAVEIDVVISTYRRL